eukprot:1152277-Pelagomonas_calceolata.AAC.4
MHVQEGRVCSTSGGHVSNHLRTKRLESWDQELSTGTHMGPIGGGLLGASQGHTIQDPPGFVVGHSYKLLLYHDSQAQALSTGTLFIVGSRREESVCQSWESLPCSKPI